MINIESFSRNKNLGAQTNWLPKENESCHNYRLQVVVNHYACNRPPSWPLNVTQATKTKINIVRVENFPQYNLPARKKKRKISEG